MYRLFFLLAFELFYPVAIFSQNWCSGTVVDTRGHLPLQGVMVQVDDTTVYTDDKGRFTFLNHRTGIATVSRGRTIKSLGLYSLQGQFIGKFVDFAAVSLYLEKHPLANYLLKITYSSGEARSITCNSISIRRSGDETSSPDNIIVKKLMLKSSDTLLLSFTRNGYYTQCWGLREDSVYEMLALKYSSLDYLHSLIRQEAFDMVKGPPLLPKQSQIRTVKVEYSLQNDSLYYVNSNKYVFHYNFATDVLGYKGTALEFNEEYSDSPDRHYILASVNYYESSDTWGLEFFPSDLVSCELVEKLYKAVARSSFFGDSLKLVVNALRFGTCTNVPLITQDEINSTQRYQALNIAEGYGYLKKVKASQLGSTVTTRHDILLLDSVPLDINPVSGIITSCFQTPLCHINILSHNRGTPNMALRDGWNDASLNQLENRLVYLNVGLDSFVVRGATISQAEAFWLKHEPSTPVVLTSDTVTMGLMSLETCGAGNVETIGGKASNFAELRNVDNMFSGLSSIPVPEGAFAIPFSYYVQHLRKNKIDAAIKAMLADSMFSINNLYRQTKLKYIQSLIKAAPIDTHLVGMIRRKIQGNGLNFTYYRFRSSTNTEDVEDFNGAGLYDSYSGSLTDADKPIDKAIKKVWASLWNYNAFEEREYYKIDQESALMAILVHRSFPNESANGVVISSIIYDRPDLEYPGVTINTQYGESSITNPDGNYTPEQIICYFFSTNPNQKYTIEYLAKSDVPGMENSTVLTDEEIMQLTDVCRDIQNHFCTGLGHQVTVDVEFKYDLVDGRRRLYIKQARTY